MWKSRRNSSRDLNNNTSIPRSSSSSFIHTSFKDVEHLFSDDDNDNDFNTLVTLDQPPRPSAATAAGSNGARRLSVFHRVHLATKIARAFSKPDSRAAVTSIFDSRATVSSSRAPVISLHDTKLLQSEPRAADVASLDSHAAIFPLLDEQLAKSDGPISKSLSEQLADAVYLSETKLIKSAKTDRQILIPGAEKRVVVYMTSLRVVRATFEACRTVQSILRGFRVSIDERDLSMDSKFLDELQTIMNEEECEENCEKTKLTLPRVFIGGKYVGGAEEVKMLHESGGLKKFVEGLPAVNCGVCESCGDFRFVLCDECRGSHKCYSEKSGFRSCNLCNENGLVRCFACFDR